MHNRYQRVVLNGQSSKWQNVNVGIPQGAVLGSPFFLIYINDLPRGPHSDVKLFADDSSLFSVTHDVDASSATLNNDLGKIQEWTNPQKFKKSYFQEIERVFIPISILIISQLKDCCPISI